MLSHYCLVRGDVAGGLRAAYLVHAAGESSPGNLPPGTRAVALRLRDEPHLDEVASELAAADVPHVVVTEDDGRRYAIGILPTEDLSAIRRVCSSLPLAR